MLKRINIICLILALLLAFKPFAYSQRTGELYKTANQLYKSNQFDSAAAIYENIVHQGYKTAEVYYNLGNCYYKVNNISKSILNYERALKISPRDEDVLHNLKIANARVIDKIVPVPQLAIISRWNDLLSSRSSGGWGIMALVFIWLALLAFVVYLFTSLRRLSFTAGVILILLSLSFAGFAHRESEEEQNPDAAILIIPNTYVKSAPDVNGNDLFMLHEGVKFNVLDRVGDWYKIHLADGKVGWLEKSTFEKI
jgi:tetratricopeptide (TPR) repeat protein